jgi:hypothetical protein
MNDDRFELLLKRLERRIDELRDMPPPYTTRMMALHGSAIFLLGVFIGALLRGIL